MYNPVISKKARNLLLVLAAGLLYYIWLILTGIGIPCIFRLATGYRCPGCGITTMILRIGNMDLKGAYLANPFIFLTWPLPLALCLMDGKPEKMSTGIRTCKNILAAGYILCLIVFGIVRNL